MSKQQSNTVGKQSSAQKQDSSRHGHKTIPAASKVQGAHGERERTGRTITEVIDDLAAKDSDATKGETN
jgi:hypothetical protein